MNTLDSVDWSSIPAPPDDDGAAHLHGLVLPSLILPGTDGQSVDLSELDGRTCLYAYPMTGRPDTPLPDGWDLIPGARGCTPQSCSFRDHAQELTGLGVTRIYGLSTQSSEYQQEAAERLQLPFPLLSDVNLAFAQAIKLPLMDVEGMMLLRRLSMIIDDGIVSKVFYPVFPPDSNAAKVIAWLSDVNTVSV